MAFNRLILCSELLLIFLLLRSSLKQSWRIKFSKILFSMARQPLGGLGRLIFRGFTITLFRHSTLGRTPLDEEPARRRNLYLTTHNTLKRQTSMLPVGFEPTILASERPQTHSLDRTATGSAQDSLFWHISGVLISFENENIAVEDHYLRRKS
jgi:hypothetical protein